MRKMKPLAFLLLFVLIFTFLTSCSGGLNTYHKIKNNAVMYSYVNDLMLPSFFEENKIEGTYQKDPDSDEEIEYPSSISLIIRDQEALNEIFYENAFSVDFEKEIVFVHVFADIHLTQYYNIYDISIDSGKVTITYILDFSIMMLGSAPVLRALAVKMDKIDVSEVEFVKKD